MPWQPWWAKSTTMFIFSFTWLRTCFRKVLKKDAWPHRCEEAIPWKVLQLLHEAKSWFTKWIHNALFGGVITIKAPGFGNMCNENTSSAHIRECKNHFSWKKSLQARLEQPWYQIKRRCQEHVLNSCMFMNLEKILEQGFASSDMV